MKTIKAPQPVTEVPDGGFSIMKMLENPDWEQIALYGIIAAMALFAIGNTIKVLTRSDKRAEESGLSAEELADIEASARRSIGRR